MKYLLLSLIILIVTPTELVKEMNKHDASSSVEFDLAFGYSDIPDKYHCEKTTCSIAESVEATHLSTCVCQLNCGHQFSEKRLISK